MIKRPRPNHLGWDFAGSCGTRRRGHAVRRRGRRLRHGEHPGRGHLCRVRDASREHAARKPETLTFDDAAAFPRCSHGLAGAGRYGSLGVRQKVLIQPGQAASATSPSSSPKREGPRSSRRLEGEPRLPAFAGGRPRHRLCREHFEDRVKDADVVLDRWGRDPGTIVRRASTGGTLVSILSHPTKSELERRRSRALDLRPANGDRLDQIAKLVDEGECVRRCRTSISPRGEGSAHSARAGSHARQTGPARLKTGYHRRMDFSCPTFRHWRVALERRARRGWRTSFFRFRRAGALARIADMAREPLATDQAPEVLWRTLQWHETEGVKIIDRQHQTSLDPFYTRAPWRGSSGLVADPRPAHARGAAYPICRDSSGREAPTTTRRGSSSRTARSATCRGHAGAGGILRRDGDGARRHRAALGAAYRARVGVPCHPNAARVYLGRNAAGGFSMVHFVEVVASSSTPPSVLRSAKLHSMSDRMAPHEVVEVLDVYFDRVAGAITARAARC